MYHLIQHNRCCVCCFPRTSKTLLKHKMFSRHGRNSNEHTGFSNDFHITLVVADAIPDFLEVILLKMNHTLNNNSNLMGMYQLVLTNM